MYKKLAMSLAVATLILGGGCTTPYSEAPVAVNFKTTEQDKLQAAQHWNVVATDIAAAVAKNTGKYRAVSLAPAPNSSFGRAFHELLLTRLVAAGVPLVKTGAAADAVLAIDTQLLEFRADRPVRTDVGLLTALTAGVWAVQAWGPEGAWATSQVLGGATALAATADALSWWRSKYPHGGTPQSELIVNASLTEGERYVARASSVYYLADVDAALYATAPAARALHVKGE